MTQQSKKGFQLLVLIVKAIVNGFLSIRSVRADEEMSNPGGVRVVMFLQKNKKKVK